MGHSFEWGQFYPKRVIQIGGVELSTQISHVKNLSRRVIKKTYPKLGDLFYLTLYTKIILTSGEPSVNGIDLLALTLARPIWHKPALDPLAVLHHLENQLYIKA